MLPRSFGPNEAVSGISPCFVAASFCLMLSIKHERCRLRCVLCVLICPCFNVVRLRQIKVMLSFSPVFHSPNLRRGTPSRFERMSTSRRQNRGVAVHNVVHGALDSVRAGRCVKRSNTGQPPVFYGFAIKVPSRRSFIVRPRHSTVLPVNAPSQSADCSKSFTGTSQKGEIRLRVEG